MADVKTNGNKKFMLLFETNNLSHVRITKIRGMHLINVHHNNICYLLYLLLNIKNLYREASTFCQQNSIDLLTNEGNFLCITWNSFFINVVFDFGHNSIFLNNEIFAMLQFVVFYNVFLSLHKYYNTLAHVH